MIGRRSDIQKLFLELAGGNDHYGLGLLFESARADIEIDDRVRSQRLNCTSFYMASSRGDTETVSLLLKEGADWRQEGLRVGIDNGMQTPLLAAVRNQHVEVVKLLLEKNAHRLDGATLLSICYEYELINAHEPMNQERDKNHQVAFELLKAGVTFPDVLSPDYFRIVGNFQENIAKMILSIKSERERVDMLELICNQPQHALALFFDISESKTEKSKAYKKLFQAWTALKKDYDDFEVVIEDPDAQEILNVPKGENEMQALVRKDADLLSTPSSTPVASAPEAPSPDAAPQPVEEPKAPEISAIQKLFEHLCYHNNHAALQFLLNAKHGEIEVNRFVKTRMTHLTPLHLVVYKERQAAVSHLLRFGARVHLVGDLGGKELTPIQICFSVKFNPAIAIMLLAHGARADDIVDMTKGFLFKQITKGDIALYKEIMTKCILSLSRAEKLKYLKMIMTLEGKPVNTELGEFYRIATGVMPVSIRSGNYKIVFDELVKLNADPDMEMKNFRCLSDGELQGEVFGSSSELEVSSPSPSPAPPEPDPAAPAPAPSVSRDSLFSLRQGERREPLARDPLESPHPSAPRPGEGEGF